LITLLFCLGSALQAQTTAVSVTAVDVQGSPYAYGYLQAVLYGPDEILVPAPTVGGNPINNIVYVALTKLGVGTIQLYPNASIDQPNTHWAVMVYNDALNIFVTGIQSTPYPFATVSLNEVITTTGVDLSSAFTPILPLIYSFSFVDGAVITKTIDCKSCTVSQWTGQLPYSRLSGVPVIPPAGAQIYGASGLIASPKCWIGSTTSNTSGVFTINYSSAGFAAAPTYIGLSSTASNSASGNFTNVTTGTVTSTGLSGQVDTGTAILLLSSFTIVADSTPQTVYVMACGN